MLSAPNEENEDDIKNGGKALIGIIGIIFLPAAIIGGLYYFILMRILKQPISVALSIGAAISAISLFFWVKLNALERFLSVLGNLANFKENWTEILPLVIVINLVLGSIFGILMIFIQIRQIKANPQKLKLEGSWLYNFKYRRTPIQVLRRKNTIKKLKEGKFASKKKAPLGLDEDNGDLVAYRYNSEATKQTLISGAAGSGKDLHIDEIIPTPHGFKRVGDINVGDTIFDDLGEHTKVVGKHQPMSQTHYALTLSDGTIIKTGEDHLWEVEHNISPKAIEKMFKDDLRLQAQVIIAVKDETLITVDDLISDYELESARKMVEIELSYLNSHNGKYSRHDALVALLEADSIINESISKNVGSFRHVEIMRTKDLLRKGLKDSSGRNKFSIKPVQNPVNYPDVELSSDPYDFGINIAKTSGDLVDEFLFSGVEQRISLLSGLIKGSGAVSISGICSFSNSNKVLVDRVRSLVSSLASVPTMIKESKGDYSFSFALNHVIELDGVVSTLVGDSSKFHRRYVTDVQIIDGKSDEFFCFEVDSPSSLFLCTNVYIPTHNTITMLSLIKANIESGLPNITIDFKRSSELATKLAKWAHENNRVFYHFVNGNPEKYDIPGSPGQALYDPLVNGGAAMADMLLGMREYDTAAEVYKSSMRQLLQVLFGMLRVADRKKAPEIDWNHGGIYQVASAIKDGNFTTLVAACVDTDVQANAEDVEVGLRSRGSNLRKAMDELQGQMRTIMVSEYGRWLRTEKGGRNIDLYKLTQGDADAVVLFSLNSDSEKDFSKYFGSLILADLNAISAKRRNLGAENQIYVYIDEFQAVPPSSVTSLLEKSRESHIGMTLSSQSYEQIISASDSNGESYLAGILDTCSNFIVHNGATEGSATRLAEILGKKYETVFTTSNQNDGFLFSRNWSNKRNQTVQNRQEERWIMHPGEFMKLSSPNQANGFRSTAVMINKSPEDPLFRKNKGGAVARTIWMIPDNEVIARYYKSTTSSDSYVAPEKETLIAPVFTDNLADESSDMEEFNDNTYDYLAERSSRRNDEEESPFEDDGYNYAGSDSEEEDGSFGFESIEDDNSHSAPDVSYALGNDDEEEYVPRVVSENKPASSKRSVLESSSFASLYKSGSSSPKEQSVGAKRKSASTASDKTSSNNGPSNRGLPTRGVPVMPIHDLPVDDEEEEDALPSLEDLM